jgi:lysophospholipase L1-like esterase
MRVFALGDSLTCGVGVGVKVPAEQIWTARLAAAVPGGQLIRLAQPGARARDVRTVQLPRLPAPRGAEVCTLLVGLNDIARSGFDAAAVRAELVETVRLLRDRGGEVVVGRLHDPAALLPLPSRVAAAARRRIAAVNAAVDETREQRNVHVLDLANVPALRQQGGWATDRVHPSAVGHASMAATAIRVLSEHGAGGRFRWLPEPVVPAGPGIAARTGWSLRHGLPYAATHLRELGSPVVSAVLRRT